ncbi:MAG: 50S ribosomal protein L17 [Deltaproteobacteria bacterium]|nr:MAG: 50S ribosomal protein L17 [Deltaproteobacteria bacterium]RLC15721.1 MAG: 50S ribosomal protein L17 [Deltaproteobacteria bacterium]
MRHRKSGVKLNMTSSHKNAMFRNMVTSLLKYDRIQTTDAKAKELRRWADHIITLAKRGDLHARRQAMSIVREKAVVHKVFEEAPKRFATVSGGYTRIVKIGRRPGDAAPVSLIELITPEPKKKKTTKKTKTATPKKTAPKKTAEKKTKVAKTETDAPEASKVTSDSVEETQAPSEAAAEETVVDVEKKAAKAKPEPEGKASVSEDEAAEDTEKKE